MSTNTDLRVELLEADAGGAFVIRNAPGLEPELRAEMTWSWREGVMVIHHTGVRPELRGRGVAGRLVQAAVTMARRDGFRIEPRCPFAARAFDKAGGGYDDVDARLQGP